MPDISKIPPLLKLVIATVVEVMGLLATQGFIDNRISKLVCGLAVIVTPTMYLVLVGITRLAHARETAARIAAGLPTRPPQS